MSNLPAPDYVVPLRPNALPRKGVAIPKFDLRSIWEAIGFTPHDGQWEVFHGWTLHDFTTNVSGTRWGKSEFAAHLPLAHIAPCVREVEKRGPGGKTLRQLVEHRTQGAVVAPTYELTRIVMGKLLSNILKLGKVLGYNMTRKGRTKPWQTEELADEEAAFGEIDPEPGVLTIRQINGSIRTIITPWGSRIDAYTMADPRGLLGKAYDWVITDEAGQFDDTDWSNWFEYGQRALLDFKGWVYHGTTPQGFNALYDSFFLPGQPGEHRDPDYISFQQPTSRNTALLKNNPDFIERERRRLPPRIFARNYLALFTVLDGQVYEEFSRDTHVRRFAASSEWAYWLAFDYGFTDPFVAQLMAWTGEEVVVVAEVYEAQLSVPEQKAAVGRMLREHLPPGAEWLDPRSGQWTTWGDPRGGQARAEWARLGVRARKPNLHLSSGQKGSIEATAQVVAEYMHPDPSHPYPAWARQPGDEGKPAPRFIVHERCVRSIHSYQSWVKVGESYKGDDHGADASRYGLLGARPHFKTWVPRTRRPVVVGAPQAETRRLPSRVMKDRGGGRLSMGRR